MKGKRLHTILGIWTNICRFALAGVFVFSGFVKAVDPLGTEYKIRDYAEAFGLSALMPDFVPLFVSVSLATLEFALGVFFFFGIRKRFATTCTLYLMAFMTLLTFCVALFDPVTDCGCFGDALILSNWATFWKNIFLLIAAVSVFKWRNRILQFVSDNSQWLVALYTVFFILASSFYSLRTLPIFDFRPYHIGANIPEGMSIPEDAKADVIESIVVMEKDGVRKEFTTANYPDTTWTFVDIKNVVVERGYSPPIEDFYIVELENETDITQEVLSDENYLFLLVAYRIDNASDSNIDLINEIYDYSVDNGYAFYCLTSSPWEEIELWKDKTGAEYPFCRSDEIALKTIIRSNPGLVLLKSGTVINKWSHNELPDEYVLTDRLERLPIGQIANNDLAKTIVNVIGWFVIPLLLFKLLDVLLLKRMISRVQKRRRELKQQQEAMNKEKEEKE